MLPAKLQRIHIAVANSSCKENVYNRNPDLIMSHFKGTVSQESQDPIFLLNYIKYSNMKSTRNKL